MCLGMVFSRKAEDLFWRNDKLIMLCHTNSAMRPATDSPGVSKEAVYEKKGLSVDWVIWSSN